MVIDGNRLVDDATGEKLLELADNERLAVLGEGDSVRRKESDWGTKLPNWSFVQLHELPYGLSKFEWEILQAILTYDHIRSTDNVICHAGNHKPARREAIAEFANKPYETRSQRELFQRHFRSLMKRGVIAKGKQGFVLNPRYAVCGKRMISKETAALFKGMY